MTKIEKLAASLREKGVNVTSDLKIKMDDAEAVLKILAMEDEEEIEPVDPNDQDAVMALAGELLSNVKEYEGYSGRGMYGKESRLAFSSSTSPREGDGAKFIKATGMSSDSLGRDFIYYYK